MRKQRMGVLPLGMPLQQREFYLQAVEPAVEKRQILTVTFPTANAEVRIRHKMGVRPVGFTVLKSNLTGGNTIYESGTRWDKNFLYLKSSEAGVTVTIEIR